MKRRITCLLLGAMLLSLAGCSKAVPDHSDNNTPEAETAAAPDSRAGDGGAVDLDTARAAYAALSEADRQLFLAEIAAEQKALEAARLDAVRQQICGEWRMEYGEDGPHYAYRFHLYEDMTFEYGKFAGSWHYEDEETIALVNREDGVTYIELTLLEEDGFLKLLCADEFLYVRSEDYKEAFGKKYVEVRFSQLEEYLGELQYVGSIPPGVWDGPTGDCYIFDSLAYDQGLIYVGRSGSNVEIELTMHYAGGVEYPSRMFSPFDLQFLPSPYTASDFFVGKGSLVFIREEYVEELNVIDGECRELRLKSGNTLYDYNLVGWEHFPAELFENFRY